MGYTYTEILFVVYLKFKFNGVSCILAGNTISKVLPRSQWPTPPLAQVGVAPCRKNLQDAGQVPNLRAVGKRLHFLTGSFPQAPKSPAWAASH